jgi:ABC-type branched-subunit amino acid transport system substrate-binding protein
MKKIYIVLLGVLIVLSTALFYMNLKKPVKVALIGNFAEERYSFATSSIIAGRIAEKEINDSSGIRGKKTELVIKEDDFSDPKSTIDYLISNRIEVIITTAGSKDLLKLKQYLDNNRIACISVGATSASLNKQNDYIFRILPDDEKEVEIFLDYLEMKNISKDIALVYDKSNMEYKNSVEQTIKKLGGSISFQEAWEGDSLNYSPSNIEAMRDKPILVLSSARQTAFIVQKLKKYGFTNNLFGMSWSGDEYLLSYGGRPIENFTFISPTDFSGGDNQTAKLEERLKIYQKKTGVIPNGIYKAYNLIKKAYIYRQEYHISLKEALDKTKVLDEYGDSIDKELIFTVRNGEFVKIGGSVDENAKD